LNFFHTGKEFWIFETAVLNFSVYCYTGKMILPKETADVICTNSEKPWTVARIIVTTKELLDIYAATCS
jgi:hypothetical protein